MNVQLLCRPSLLPGALCTGDAFSRRTRPATPLRTPLKRSPQRGVPVCKAGHDGPRGQIGSKLEEGKQKLQQTAGKVADKADEDLTWYRKLDKPWWSPPEQIFGPVWTTLYICMGVASWLVYRDAGKDAAFPLTVFGSQLLFNFLWPYLFFEKKQPGLALLDNILVITSLLATYRLYKDINPTAGLLIAPSIAWVSFAITLNAVIYARNKNVTTR